VSPNAGSETPIANDRERLAKSPWASQCLRVEGERDEPKRFSEAFQHTEAIAATLIGLDEVTATTVAEREGRITRVERRDGERLSLRADFRINRIDLTVENGVVVATRVG
jgi:hypothetical protein